MYTIVIRKPMSCPRFAHVTLSYIRGLSPKQRHFRCFGSAKQRATFQDNLFDVKKGIDIMADHRSH
ncbi:hypothetical protein MAR_026813 [Mya arenaria]|uniref:Uncharacterized protein n=1 Tax=Mya arenaria TaxID=6604 RepID=A0ABY7ERP7_MYAAR|nr:hypothetical protein MAR_026813 [Mya arenaria]